MVAPALVLDAFVPYRLAIASNVVSDAVASAYKALFGLTIPEWRIVAVLAETSGISQAELGTRTRMDKVAVSRAAIALVGRGLLARQPNASDARSHLVTLTKPGRALHAAVVPKALELEQAIFAAFAPDEMARFVAMLRRVEAVALALVEGEA